jgi:hypothetical protein
MVNALAFVTHVFDFLARLFSRQVILANPHEHIAVLEIRILDAREEMQDLEHELVGCRQLSFASNTVVVRASETWTEEGNERLGVKHYRRAVLRGMETMGDVIRIQCQKLDSMDEAAGKRWGLESKMGRSRVGEAVEKVEIEMGKGKKEKERKDVDDLARSVSELSR